jgi:hypothetical protein
MRLREKIRDVLQVYNRRLAAACIEDVSLKFSAVPPIHS